MFHQIAQAQMDSDTLYNLWFRSRDFDQCLWIDSPEHIIVFQLSPINHRQEKHSPGTGPKVSRTIRWKMVKDADFDAGRILKHFQVESGERFSWNIDIVSTGIAGYPSE